MNRDIVVQGTAETLLATLGIDAAPLVETAISDDTALRGAALLRQKGSADHLGGSAFNAARVAALLNADRSLEIAFFGIAGTISAASPHHDALLGWGFDVSGVLIVPRPPATCAAANGHAWIGRRKSASARKILTSARPERARVAVWNFSFPERFDRPRIEEGEAFPCRLMRRTYG